MFIAKLVLFSIGIIVLTKEAGILLESQVNHMLFHIQLLVQYQILA
jgi:hypothetical protein